MAPLLHRAVIMSFTINVHEHFGCTDRRRKRKRNLNVTSANPVYRCEELEDSVSSVYDEIEIDENQYDESIEKSAYLKVLSDEAYDEVKEKRAQPQPLSDETEDSKPPLPSLRPKVYLQLLSDEAYVDLNEKHARHQIPGDEADGRDQCGKPRSPSPITVSESQGQNQYCDYRSLNDSKLDLIYLQTSNDETEGRDQDINAQDQDQDLDSNTQCESHDQDSNYQEQSKHT